MQLQHAQPGEALAEQHPNLDCVSLCPPKAAELTLALVEEMLF